MVFHADGSQKKADVAIFISGKIDFKSKKVTRDKDWHYVLIKGTIHQENIIVIIKSIKIYEESMNRPEEENWQQRNNGRGF